VGQMRRSEAGPEAADGANPAEGTSRRWRWVPLLVVAIVTAGVVILAGYGALTLVDQLRGRTAAGEANVGTSVGSTAPDVTVYDLSGNEVHLADLRGKTVLLNFRATWCGYCRAEAPALQQAHESDKDLAIVAVYVNEDAATVSDFATAETLTFPMYTDSGDAARTFGVQGIPSSFFIDAKGRIFATSIGSLTYPSIKSYLAEQ
jgi:cytochrome c biogenesis protein CcmG, thiol:disulfide interchange protein DsbE